MTFDEAKKELKHNIIEQGDLYNGMAYMKYKFGENGVVLDGVFFPDTLEALAIYIREAQKS